MRKRKQKLFTNTPRGKKSKRDAWGYDKIKLKETRDTHNTTLHNQTHKKERCIKITNYKTKGNKKPTKKNKHYLNTRERIMQR